MAHLAAAWLSVLAAKPPILIATTLIHHAMLPQQLPDLLGRDWDIDMADAKVPERINNSVGNRRWCADGRRLADALSPDRVVRRWRDRLADLPLGCLDGGWQQIVGKGACEICPTL